MAAVRQGIAELPEGSVVLAEDETHLFLATKAQRVPELPSLARAGLPGRY